MEQYGKVTTNQYYHVSMLTAWTTIAAIHLPVIKQRKAYLQELEKNPQTVNQAKHLIDVIEGRT